MRTAVIVNPAAGAGRSERHWPRRRELLRRALGAFEELVTARRGHATALAREALAAGAERVIAVGGDGTWHELVNGYLETPEPARARAALGLFPAGSGCDFARHMGFPRDDAAVAGLLAAGKLARVDAVEARVSREGGGEALVRLTNMAAFGLGGEVAVAVERAGKALGGTLSYLLASLRLILTSRARPYALELDGRALPETRLHAAILANTSTTGGGMRVAPDADACDGLFELVLIGEMGRLAMLRRFGRLYSGTHLGQPGVRLYRGRRLRARALEPGSFPLNLDGEAFGCLPAEFTALPGAVPVIIS